VNRRAKPPSPTTTPPLPTAPSLGSTEKTSTAAQSKYRWPWSERHLAEDSAAAVEAAADLVAAVEAAADSVVVAAAEMNRPISKDVLETGSVPLKIAATPTLHGEMSATNVNNPDQKVSEVVTVAATVVAVEAVASVDAAAAAIVVASEEAEVVIAADTVAIAEAASAAVAADQCAVVVETGQDHTKPHEQAPRRRRLKPHEQRHPLFITK